MAKKAKRAKLRMTISPAAVWAVVIIILAGVGYYASRNIEGSKAFVLNVPKTIFVSEQGNDNNEGTKVSPVRSIRVALGKVSTESGNIVVIMGPKYGVLEGDLDHVIPFGSKIESTITTDKAVTLYKVRNEAVGALQFSVGFGSWSVQKIDFGDVPLNLTARGSSKVMIKQNKFGTDSGVSGNSARVEAVGLDSAQVDLSVNVFRINGDRDINIGLVYGNYGTKGTIEGNVMLYYPKAGIATAGSLIGISLSKLATVDIHSGLFIDQTRGWVSYESAPRQRMVGITTQGTEGEVLIQNNDFHSMPHDFNVVTKSPSGPGSKENIVVKNNKS